MASKGASLKYFFSGNGTNKLNAFAIPVMGFTTDPMNLTDYDGPWILEVHRSASDSTVRYTLEASTDGTNWTLFDDRAENLDIPCQLSKSNLRPNYFRVVVDIDPLVPPTGTITIFFQRINSNRS
jgi:hypothetical protein